MLNWRAVALSNDSLPAMCPWAALNGSKSQFMLLSKEISIIYHLLVSQLGSMMIKRRLIRSMNFSD